MIFEVRTWLLVVGEQRKVIEEYTPMYKPVDAAAQAEVLKQPRFVGKGALKQSLPNGQVVEQPFAYPIEGAATIDQAFGMSDAACEAHFKKLQAQQRTSLITQGLRGPLPPLPGRPK